VNAPDPHIPVAPRRLTPESLACVPLMPVTPPAWTPEAEVDRPWTWRNLRGLHLSVVFWPCPWQWHVASRIEHATYYEFSAHLQIGPFEVGIFADTGNVSSESPWRARFGLSDDEAWERADRG
jgi:hypothetical protein